MGGPGGEGGGGAFFPKHQYGYVAPIGVVILELLIYNGVSITKNFPRTGYNNSFVQIAVKLTQD